MEFFKIYRLSVYAGFIIRKLEEKDFQRNIKEFWFEVYHVGKYIFRHDLWTAKFRDWSAKEWLRQMLEWNIGAHKKLEYQPKE